MRQRSSLAATPAAVAFALVAASGLGPSAASAQPVAAAAVPAAGPSYADLADLATDELIAKKRPEPRRRAETSRSEDKGGVLAEYGLSEEQGNEIIMAARAHWFEDEPADKESGEDASADEAQ